MNGPRCDRHRLKAPLNVPISTASGHHRKKGENPVEISERNYDDMSDISRTLVAIPLSKNLQLSWHTVKEVIKRKDIRVLSSMYIAGAGGAKN